MKPNLMVLEWRSYVAEMPLTHAITLTYNNHGIAMAGPCWQISSEGSNSVIRARSTRFGAPHRGREIGMDRLRRDLRRFHADVDRRIFGTRFHKLPLDRRTSYVAVAEHRDSNIHLHLGWNTPLVHGGEHESLLEAVQPFWAALVPNGTSAVEPVYDAAGWASYMFKNVRNASDASRILVNGEA